LGKRIHRYDTQTQSQSERDFRFHIILGVTAKNDAADKRRFEKISLFICGQFWLKVLSV
jgi:hypothetical protein